MKRKLQRNAPASARNLKNRAAVRLAVATRRYIITATKVADLVAAQPEGTDVAADDRRLTERLSSTERKQHPMAEGLLDYFPDALALVANVSWIGNEKHNPGEPLHHSRGKSGDHADCVVRHALERGGFDTVTINGVQHRIRHTAALAWRALALLQEELERDLGLPLPRNARVDLPPTAQAPART